MAKRSAKFFSDTTIDPAADTADPAVAEPAPPNPVQDLHDELTARIENGQDESTHSGDMGFVHRALLTLAKALGAGPVEPEAGSGTAEAAAPMPLPDHPPPHSDENVTGI